MSIETIANSAQQKASAIKSSMTRRQMLRAMRAISATVVGGAALTACGGTSGSNENVTIYTNGWPVAAMPSKEDQSKDPAQKAYASILQEWLEKHPGVAIKASSVDIWKNETLTTAISAGTAPSFYPASPLGNYDDAAIRAAMLKGFAADVTEHYSKHGLAEQMPDYARNTFEEWKLNGKFYSAPADFFAGNGIIYRRDLIQEAGLEEPKPGWTWSDFAALAKGLTKDKVKGASVQQWVLDWILRINGFELLSTIPAPKANWHWSYDYTSQITKWTQVVDTWRKAYFGDKSILADPSYDDSAVAKAFARGDVAMMPNNYGFFTRIPTDPDGASQIADRLQKKIGDVIGFVAHPVGETGQFGNSGTSMGAISFSPKLSSTALASTYDLYVHFFFGQGYIDQKVATYEATKDLRYVYDTVVPRNKITSFPGINGTIEEVWGKHYVDAVQTILDIPLLPKQVTYFPAEANTGPTNDAYNDARSVLTFSEKSVEETITRMQQVKTQQAASFTSSVPQAEFITGAKKYYADLDAFWKKHAPEFYSREFHLWYEQKVLPVLK